MDLFDLAVRRRCRGVELHYKIVKKAAPTEQARHRQVGRESCHGLKGITEHENPNLVKIEQTPRSAGNSLQVILYPILEASNTQRMAYSRMKNARIRARINPAGDRFCWPRMAITESNVQNGSPSRDSFGNAGRPGRISQGNLNEIAPRSTSSAEPSL